MANLKALEDGLQFTGKILIEKTAGMVRRTGMLEIGTKMRFMDTASLLIIKGKSKRDGLNTLNLCQIRR
jgi:hypothetical protein